MHVRLYGDIWGYIGLDRDKKGYVGIMENCIETAGLGLCKLPPLVFLNPVYPMHPYVPYINPIKYDFAPKHTHPQHHAGKDSGVRRG